MTVLDPSNPLGYELLGDCYILMERWDEARTSFELGRDTSFMNRSNSKPRCYKILQQTIAAEAADYGITVVNLPVIFKQVYGMVPDRALFLDYCHLTVQGIKTAMRYTAHAILEHLDKKTIPIEAIPESVKTPDKDIEAVAHFCAAIHNAHNGQAFDMVRYHCDKAIPGSGMVKGLMEKFIDFSTRHASTLLCRSFEELIIEQEMRQYEGGLGLANPPGQKLMDVELVNLMAGLLGEATSKEINTLRIQEHGLGSEKKNLLEPFYSTTYYKAMVRNRYPNFLQAKTTETSFQFIADKKALAFDLVYRTPNRYYPDMSVKVYLNNKQQLLAELPMSAQWTKCVFMVRDEWVQPGLNTLMISWPYTGEPFPGEPCTSIFSFINGVFPSLGEIIAINAMVYEKENILIDAQNSLLTADAIFNELL